MNHTLLLYCLLFSKLCLFTYKELRNSLRSFIHLFSEQMK